MSKTILCALLLSAFALGQSSNYRPDSPEGKLLALEKMWNQAQLMRDADAVNVLIAPHFVNTEWDGEVSDRQRFLSDIRDPKFKPSVLGIQDVQVILYGETAVVTGTYHAKGSYQGKPYDHVGRFTDTWIRENQRWQCVASHTSLIGK